MKDWRWMPIRVLWWLKQSDEARKCVFFDEEITKPIREVYEKFSEFCKGASSVWSHATFDASIILRSYTELNMKTPFHYRSARDLRTIVHLAKYSKEDLHKNKFNREGVHHDALDDCKYQVRYAVECLKRINGK